MVSFPPFLPSAKWMADYFGALRSGTGNSEAMVKANSKITDHKEFARSNIRDTRGNIQVVSMAIAGGGRQLRNLSKMEGLYLSEHGDWRKNHLGTFEACLGKTPFYHHIEGALKTIYENRDATSLEHFNTAIFRELTSFLLGNEDSSSLKFDLYKNAVKARGEEVAEGIDPDMTILQSLSVFGKETLLGLLALESEKNF